MRQKTKGRTTVRELKTQRKDLMHVYKAFVKALKKEKEIEVYPLRRVGFLPVVVVMAPVKLKPVILKVSGVRRVSWFRAAPQFTK